MKKIKKIIAATVASFAVIATISATTAFANSDAVNSVDGINASTPGRYMDLSYGAGYAITINTTSNLRLAGSSVKVRNSSGKLISEAEAHNNGVIGPSQNVPSNVESKYIVKGYSYDCSGHIYGDASSNSPIVETINETYYN